MKWGAWAMKCKTSLFNRGLLIDNLKRFGWIGVVYTLALFFCMPLNILMNYDMKNHYYFDFEYPIQSIFYNNIDLNFQSSVMVILIIVIPILTAMLLFRYMHVRKSVDTIHTLPFKREEIYNNRIVAGFIIMVVPVLLTGLLSLILRYALHIEQYYSVADIGYWLGFTILMNSVIFLFSVFMGMISGLSAVQGGLSIIMLLLPTAFIFLLFVNLEILLHGFASEYYFNENILIYFSPIIRMLNFDKFKVIEVVIYIVLCFFFYYAAKIAYKRRALEHASKAIAFDSLQPLFKYGVTLCAMLLVGTFFWAEGDYIYWVYFGYLIGSLLGYFIAEIILNKSLKVFTHIKGYLVYAGLVIILLLGIQSDVIGYEQYVPPINQVEKIYFNKGTYEIREKGEKLRGHSEAENIKNIQKLHQVIINNGRQNLGASEKTTRLIFYYQLNNGRKVARKYDVHQELYAQYLKPICESKEYKRMHNSILDLETNTVELIEIKLQLGVNKKAVIVDPEHIAQVINILKKEVMNETYEQMTDPRASWANIKINTNEKEIIERGRWTLEQNVSVHQSWKKHYSEFEEWLMENDYLYDPKALVGDDIAYAIVEMHNSDEGHGYWIEEGNQNVKQLRIEDVHQLEQSIMNYSNALEDTKYIIEFYTKGGNGLGVEGFDEEHVPDFVKAYFESTE